MQNVQDILGASTNFYSNGWWKLFCLFITISVIFGIVLLLAPLVDAVTDRLPGASRRRSDDEPWSDID